MKKAKQIEEGVGKMHSKRCSLGLCYRGSRKEIT